MSLALLTLAVLNVASLDAQGVSLIGAESHLHGLLLAQADAPPPPPPPSVSPNMGVGGNYEGWSLEQLQRESRRLNDLRPSLVGPIVLLAVGAGITVFLGVPFLLSGVSILYATGVAGFLIAGLVFAVPGVAMIVIGSIWLSSRIAERREAGEQIDEIEMRIRNYREAPSSGVPQVEQYRPAPTQLVLARF